jgi:hypothetical protein
MLAQPSYSMPKARTLTRRRLRKLAAERKARRAANSRRYQEQYDAEERNARIKVAIPDWEQQLFDRDVRLGLILLNKTPKC